MNDSSRNEMVDAHADIVAAMPPTVRGIYDGLLATITKHLGESPEAWRGACVVIQAAMPGMVLHDDDHHDQGKYMVMLVFIGVLSSPWAKAATS